MVKLRILLSCHNFKCAKCKVGLLVLIWLKCVIHLASIDILPLQL
jgi:hypothetical protein